MCEDALWRDVRRLKLAPRCAGKPLEAGCLDRAVCSPQAVPDWRGVPELPARARLHDTIVCRNRLRRLAGFCRDEGSPPHQDFGGAAAHGRDRALSQARFLLEVTASQAILSRIRHHLTTADRLSSAVVPSSTA